MDFYLAKLKGLVLLSFDRNQGVLIADLLMSDIYFFFNDYEINCLANLEECNHQFLNSHKIKRSFLLLPMLRVKTLMVLLETTIIIKQTRQKCFTFYCMSSPELL